MILVYPSGHARHRPPYEIFNGTPEPHAEVPERIERIRKAIESIGDINTISAKRFPLSWVERVHDKGYIRYLADASRIAGSAYTYPSVFPYADHRGVTSAIARRGQYAFDLYTPINNTTYDVACQSAFAALTAALEVRSGERIAYALCRPPGHHAEYARMGGYCYFNNAAIAAEYLCAKGRVAVLDIDVHHGNGTQHIFYRRKDVLVVNIHANPGDKFPFFSGNAHERGEGKGVGYNKNFPLKLKTGDRTYHKVLGQALGVIKSFAPKYLVVSAGYDAHMHDPIGGLSLTTDYYHRMGSAIAGLNIPSVLVQEGGYNTSTLGDVAKMFVEGFLSTD
jgi:acetoin utilization deacetylase AcuC-like enzyme